MLHRNDVEEETKQSPSNTRSASNREMEIKNLFKQFEYKISLLVLKRSDISRRLFLWCERRRKTKGGLGWGREEKKWFRFRHSSDKSNEKWFWLKFSLRLIRTKAFCFSSSCSVCLPIFTESASRWHQINGWSRSEDALLPLHLTNNISSPQKLFISGGRLTLHSCKKQIHFD